MKLPVIVCEHGDISFFSSIEAAALALEAVDVKNGEYTAYDGDGRRLSLSIISERRNGFLNIFSRYIEKVRVSECLSAEKEESKLRELLISYSDRAGLPLDDVKDRELSSLIDKIVEKVGYTT